MITTSTRVEDADIAGLLARVEAATGPDRYLDACIIQAVTPELHDAFADHVGFVVGGNHEQPTRAPELTASIDAALALVERMLPGWRLGLYQMAGHWQASLAEVDEETDLAVDDYFADGPTAPLAILAALLSQGAGHEQ